MTTALWIKRDDIREHQFVQQDLPTQLDSQHILLKIEYFAFTANNTTYAHSGEALGYWQFFPTDDAAWGKLPVWGFANVIASEHPDIAVGEHIYGFFPLASHCILQADKVSEGSFVDAAAHRQSLNPVYNRYTRTAHAEGFQPEHDYLNALLRPMFTTSFLLDDFLADNDFFGADVVVASSASSKTAYGMAFMLHQERPNRRPYEIVGLTSPHNVDFVQSLGIYDTVLTYDTLTQIDADTATVYVDFAGNGRTRKTIHEHLGDNMKHNAIVGGTHWDQLGTAKGLPGAKPQFFFAPAQVQKRMSDWGRAQYQQKSDSAWMSFLDAAQAWMDIQVLSGEQAVASMYDDMLAGKLNPRDGLILSL